MVADMLIEASKHYIKEDWLYHQLTETEPNLVKAEEVALNSLDMWCTMIQLIKNDTRNSTRDGYIKKDFILDAMRYCIISLGDKRKEN